MALKQIGIAIDTYLSSEIDDFSKIVTMVRHPEVTQLGDPRSIDDRVSLSMHLSNDPVDDAHEALLLARKKK